jgi:polyhydroxybutyrate depolymerase
MAAAGRLEHRPGMKRAACLAAWTVLVLTGVAARGDDDERVGCHLTPGHATPQGEVPLGEVRRYDARVGAKAVAPAPVMIVFHAWGGRESALKNRLDPDRYWPEAVLIAPVGLHRMLPEAGPRRRPGWQFVQGEYGDRDIAFFDALLEDVSERFCIDPDRVTLSGYSNGGAFANLLACLRSEKIAGIAPVSSSGPPDGLVCHGSVPVLVQHGRDDDVIPLRDGLHSFGRWARYNACEAPPDDLPRGCTEAVGCAVPTRFCLTLFGHGWPTGTSQRIVEFLGAQRRRPAVGGGGR